MRYHVRCRDRACYTRRVLPKHPDEYKILPACRNCGQRIYTIDKWMMERDTTKDTCMCSGYKWEGFDGKQHSNARHRRGSLRCHFNTDGTQRLPGDPKYYYESEEEREWYENQAEQQESSTDQAATDDKFGVVET